MQYWTVSGPREERSLLNEIHPFLESSHEIQIALSAAEVGFGKEMRMLHQTEANYIRRLSHKLNMAHTDTKKLWELYLC